MERKRSQYRRRIEYATFMVQYWGKRKLEWEKELLELEGEWKRLSLSERGRRRWDREGDKAQAFARRLGGKDRDKVEKI